MGITGQYEESALARIDILQANTTKEKVIKESSELIKTSQDIRTRQKKSIRFPSIFNLEPNRLFFTVPLNYPSVTNYNYSFLGNRYLQSSFLVPGTSLCHGSFTKKVCISMERSKNGKYK